MYLLSINCFQSMGQGAHCLVLKLSVRMSNAIMPSYCLDMNKHWQLTSISDHCETKISWMLMLLFCTTGKVCTVATGDPPSWKGGGGCSSVITLLSTNAQQQVHIYENINSVSFNSAHVFNEATPLAHKGMCSTPVSETWRSLLDGKWNVSALST